MIDCNILKSQQFKLKGVSEVANKS